MTKKEKLLKRALNNSNGLSFTEFCTLMKQNGWLKDHQTGSHQIWYSPRGDRISVQESKGKAKGYQVRQFLSHVKERL